MIRVIILFQSETFKVPGVTISNSMSVFVKTSSSLKGARCEQMYCTCEMYLNSGASEGFRVISLTASSRVKFSPRVCCVMQPVKI